MQLALHRLARTAIDRHPRLHFSFTCFGFMHPLFLNFEHYEGGGVSNSSRKQFSDSKIHSFSSLSYDRSIVSCKASSSQRAIYFFLFQFPIFSRFLNFIQ